MCGELDYGLLPNKDFRAAIKLAQLMREKLKLDNLSADDLSIFIKENWFRVSILAHEIHGGSRG